MGSRWALGGMKQVGPRGCGDGRVVARTPGACGSAGRSGEEEEGCGSRGLGLLWTPSGPKVEKGRGPASRGGWGQRACEPRKGLSPAFGVPQALVDDTEDVSLDFGNEEELAFRKAKIRYAGTGHWASIPRAANAFIHIHSFRMY